MKAPALKGAPPALPTLEQRLAAGRALRARVPRSSPAKWRPPVGRDPIGLIELSDKHRVATLLPLRYQRMQQSPFAFYRGTAVIMASDLSGAPVSGLKVQTGGDCHLLNFGVFATPERHLVFDINDFDETLAAPWEWDVARLAASVVLAGRTASMGRKDCRRAALVGLLSYRERMREFARMTALDGWYARIDAAEFANLIDPANAAKLVAEASGHVMTNASEHMLPKLARVRDGKETILDNPPLIYHSIRGERADIFAAVVLGRYKDTLRDDVRVLFDRYKLIDVASKVVGVGSVGTRCGIALLMASAQDALFLQVKEATASVLERYAGASQYHTHGERVVMGQRLMQAASDIFLGYGSDDDGRDYYVRQLRDMKSSVDLRGISPKRLAGYASLCGWALARAHARSGRPGEIAGYLGKADVFGEAMADFAGTYADLVENDFKVFTSAVKSGRLKT